MMNRRRFLHNSLAVPVASAAPGVSGALPIGQVAGGKISLRDKFFGCIVGSHVGSAMGVVVEGWPYDRTEKVYGTLDKLVRS